MAGVTEVTKDHVSHDMGMHTEGLRGRSQQRFFDITEENVGFGYPDALDVDFNKRAEIDAESLDSRQINQQLRDLMKKGYRHDRAAEPRLQAFGRRRHPQPAEASHRGQLRVFRLRSLDGPNISIKGRVGWACGENMLAGTIVIEKNAGSQFGAAIRGGDLVCKGSVGARTGIDQKGGTIIVGGDTGSFTGFMMQRGRMVICGNAGKNLGDSMYDGTIYHRRRAAQPGRRRGAGRT